MDAACLSNSSAALFHRMNNSCNSDEGPKEYPSLLLFLAFLFVYCMGFITNAFVSYVFYREPQLHTQFSIYLYNILIANLAGIFIQLPFSLLKQYHSVWPYSTSFCMFYLATDYSLLACKIISHVVPLIVAYFGTYFPFRYRVYHTKYRAIVVCAITGLSVILLVLLDILHMAIQGYLDCTHSCDIFRLLMHSEYFLWIFHYIPEAMAVCVGPILWCAWKRARIRRPNSHRPSEHEPSDSDPFGQWRIPKSPPAVDQGRQIIFVVGLFTLSGLITMTPIAVVSEFRTTSAVRQCVRLLYELQAVADPVLFFVAQKNLRRCILHRLKNLCRHK